MSIRYVPPRVPIADPRTGLITREWYLFLSGLMDGGVGSDGDEAALLAAGASVMTTDTEAGRFAEELAVAPVAVADPVEDDLRRLEPPADWAGADELFAPPQTPADVYADDLSGILGYVPANRAGDTFTGLISVPGIKVRGNGTFASPSLGVSLFTGNDGYKIGFDSANGTRGLIRYNVDTVSTVHGHIFSGGSTSGPTDVFFIRTDGVIFAYNLPTYATDAAAGAGGLTKGALYQTSTGEVRIKL